MDRVQHFNHNANRVSFQLFGKHFSRLSFEQMTAVEKAIKIELRRTNIKHMPTVIFFIIVLAIKLTTNILK